MAPADPFPVYIAILNPDSCDALTVLVIVTLLLVTLDEPAFQFQDTLGKALLTPPAVHIVNPSESKEVNEPD